jgi:adenylate cyclase
MDSYDKQRVAVLPFVNISPDPNDEYFADGLTEELITALSHVHGLQVIARTTMMQYKGANKHVSTIGNELMVGTVLEGSIRKAMNKIRVTVQMIDVSSEAHLWSNIYDRELNDIFAIQSDISSNVIDSLPVHLTRSETEKLAEKETTDLSAYTDFLKAKKLIYERSEPSLKQALELFQNATKKQPNFARAYLGIAEAHLRLANQGVTPFFESVEIAKKMLGKAIAIDDRLADAHSMISRISRGEDVYDLAESEARKAIEFNPSLPDAYLNLAMIRGTQGNLDDAVKLLETAYRLDPLEKTVISSLGLMYFYAGKEKEALEHWNKTIRFVPYRTNCFLTEYYILKGEYEKAEETIAKLREINPADFFTTMWTGYLAAVRGEREKALEIIAKLRESSREGSMVINIIGFIYYALGNLDGFFDSLNRSLKLHTFPAIELRSPLFAQIRDDPRYRKVYEELLRTASGSKAQDVAIISNKQEIAATQTSAKEVSFSFASDKAKLLFDYLVRSYIEDYMTRKYASEKSGWRGLVQAANDLKVGSSIFYGKEGGGGFSPAVNELIRKGFVEARIFPGERGRGGEVTRLRVAYEKEPITDYVRTKIRSG